MRLPILSEWADRNNRGAHPIYWLCAVVRDRNAEPQSGSHRLWTDGTTAG